MVSWRSRTAATAPYVDERHGQPVEGQAWQAEVRKYDRELVGELGSALDIVAALAGDTPITVENTKGKVFDLPILTDGSKWKYTASFSEAISRAVRSLALVGEFDIVRIREGGKVMYEIMQCSQRKKTSNGDVQFYEYMLNGTGKKTLKVPKDDVQRVWCPSSENLLEAYSQTRRALTDLRIIYNLKAGVDNVAWNNRSFLRVLHFGKVDNSYRQNLETQVPPVVLQARNLAQDMVKGERLAPFYPMVGETPPDMIDMSIPQDPNMPDIMEMAIGGLARSLNLPVRLLTGEAGSHWADWKMDVQVQTYFLKPLLSVVLAGFDKFILSEEKRDVPDAIGILRFVAKFPMPVSSSSDIYAYTSLYDRGIASREVIAEKVGLSSDDLLPLSGDEYNFWVDAHGQDTGGTQ